MSVAEAVRRDLSLFEARDPNVAETTLAATALALAERIDGGMAASALPLAAKELREHMDQIEAGLPEEVKNNRLTLIRNEHSRRANGTGRESAA